MYDNLLADVPTDLWVGGAWKKSSDNARFDVIDPATENKVAFARQAFNDAVTAYNTEIQKFPNNVLAGMTGFAPAQLFEAESPKEREAPRVAF